MDFVWPLNWSLTVNSFGSILLGLVCSPAKLPYHIGCLTHAWSIKYRQITKLNAQIETNLRDKFFKPNKSMIWQGGATVNMC
jgi:hypothetical protein